LETTVDISTWTSGIIRDKLRSTQVGKIANIEGTALVAPNALGDLLSMMEMIKHTDGSFLGDSKTVTILDGQDPNEDITEEVDPNESQTLIHLDQQPHYSATYSKL
jgi:hypothetical protein